MISLTCPMNSTVTVCTKCNKVFEKPRGQGQSYCSSCHSSYAKTLYRLKKDNPIPDDHKCEICGKSSVELRPRLNKHGLELNCWFLDHDHQNGRFRGYLCMNCNLGLGKFMDDPEILANAIKYLSQNSVEL